MPNAAPVPKRLSQAQQALTAVSSLCVINIHIRNALIPLLFNGSSYLRPSSSSSSVLVACGAAAMNGTPWMRRGPWSTIVDCQSTIPVADENARSTHYCILRLHCIRRYRGKGRKAEELKQLGKMAKPAAITLVTMLGLAVAVVALGEGSSSSNANNSSNKEGLRMGYYSESCPQAEEIIGEQVRQLYKRHKNTAFSWLRNIFHDCFVESCDASLLLDAWRGSGPSEKDAHRSFGMRNFRYVETIKEALERECPGVVSCADVLVLSARDAVVNLGGPFIPLKTGRRDGRKIRPNWVLEAHLPDHNESLSVVLDRFGGLGIDAAGVTALLGAHSVGRTHCVKLVHRLYPTVDPKLVSADPDQVAHMLKKCPHPVPHPKAVQYVRNDRGTPMVLDNNYYRNLVAGRGLLQVDQQLFDDPRTRPFVLKMAKSSDFFFSRFAKALRLLSENNPLTGSRGEIRRVCYAKNRRGPRNQ